jgi:flagellar hook-basal body complex protein FliE
MMISGIGALDFKAIGGASGLAQGSGPATATQAVDATGSFASVLSDLASRTVGTLEQAEQMSVQGLQGQVDTREVVDAVMSAEQALTAAVAIRDKIVSAYMEISRMAI